MFSIPWRARAARAFVLSVSVFLFLASPACATVPPYIPDEELAEYPVIVVARWNKAPLRVHALVGDSAKGKITRKTETHTELLIERVVKGDVKSGVYKILLLHIGWPPDGGRVMSHTSCQMYGEAEEVTESNLWFLVPQRSWDKKDQHEYLGLDTYRGVQPLKLEGYFRALLSKDPTLEVPKLLTSDDPQVLGRVLEYVAGDVSPWPYGSPYGPDALTENLGTKRRQPLTKHAPAVEKLLDRNDAETRQLATAVYAELAGRDAVPRLRRLLSDSNGTVRGIAIGILAGQNDRESSAAICRAARGIKDPTLACAVIKRLAAWKNPEIVPALMEFLQNDGFAYQNGDDLGIPALKAQTALKELTGYDFPFNTRRSQQAWTEASSIAVKEQRLVVLAQAAPYEAQPLRAEIIRDKGDTHLLLVNRTKQEIVIPKEPAGISYQWTNGSGGGASPKKAEHKGPFMTLLPGERLRVDLNSDWADQSRLKKLTVYFLDNGNQVGVDAWIGRVEIVFEPK
jgi:hypothetical protein